MYVLEVVPGRDIGKLHVLKKVGNVNGEDCFLCRDESGRNIQFVESEIIAQAGEVPEVVEEEVVDEPTQEEETTEEEEVPGGASVEMTEEAKEETSEDAEEGKDEEEESKEDSEKEDSEEESPEDEKPKKGWFGKNTSKKKGGK